jgi:hypothetical protein
LSSPAIDFELSRFSRPIGLTHDRLREGGNPSTNNFPNILPPFRGLLHLDIEPGKAPQSALSYLILRSVVKELTKDNSSSSDSMETFLSNRNEPRDDSQNTEVSRSQPDQLTVYQFLQNEQEILHSPDDSPQDVEPRRQKPEDSDDEPVESHSEKEKSNYIPSGTRTKTERSSSSSADSGEPATIVQNPSDKPNMLTITRVTREPESSNRGDIITSRDLSPFTQRTEGTQLLKGRDTPQERGLGDRSDSSMSKLPSASFIGSRRSPSSSPASLSLPVTNTTTDELPPLTLSEMKDSLFVEPDQIDDRHIEGQSLNEGYKSLMNSSDLSLSDSNTNLPADSPLPESSSIDILSATSEVTPSNNDIEHKDNSYRRSPSLIVQRASTQPEEARSSEPIGLPQRNPDRFSNLRDESQFRERPIEQIPTNHPPDSVGAITAPTESPSIKDIDLPKLVDQVYNELERKLQIERERRGR